MFGVTCELAISDQSDPSVPPGRPPPRLERLTRAEESGRSVSSDNCCQCKRYRRSRSKNARSPPSRISQTERRISGFSSEPLLYLINGRLPAEADSHVATEFKLEPQFDQRRRQPASSATGARRHPHRLHERTKQVTGNSSRPLLVCARNLLNRTTVLSAHPSSFKRA